MDEMRVDKRGFEIQTCGRCGGTGQYSYCQMYGTTCFGCRGRKVVYTKRANAALAFLRELRTVQISDVQPGWFIWCDASPYVGPAKSGWYAVEEVKPSACAQYSTDLDGNKIRIDYVDVVTKDLTESAPASAKVQAVADQAALTATLAKAIEHQATLTKTGKPMARKARVEVER